VCRGFCRNGIMSTVGEEIELAAKTAGEMVAALAEASGALGPPQQFWAAIASGIHYRFQPRVARQAMAAADKIRSSGLSTKAYSAFSDPLLRAILEGAAMEDDASMQERWACLLANALTDGSARVTRAFPELLRRLEPSEAKALDALAGRVDFSLSPEEQEFKDVEVEPTGIDGIGLDSLVALGLMRYTREMPTTLGRIGDRGITVAGVSLTNLGWAFVQACRDPQPQEQSSPWVWVEPYDHSEGKVS
jgi:hypothetical protein